MGQENALLSKSQPRLGTIEHKYIHQYKVICSIKSKTYYAASLFNNCVSI